MASFIQLLTVLAGFTLAYPIQADMTIVDVKGEGVNKVEKSQTQVGFSSTRIFYTLADRSIVFVVHIDNKIDSFPASGTVHQLSDGVTADDLAKWVNNQHSDALFADVPEPVASHKLPADAIKTVSSKLIGEAEGGPVGVKYQKYSVELSGRECDVTRTLKLAAFKEAATVYVDPAAVIKVSPLKTLKGKHLLIGTPAIDGVTWEGVENVGRFREGATRVGLNHPMANFEKRVGDFLAVIELESPLNQEQLDAYAAFAKQHPAETAPALIIEFPKEKPQDQATVKGRVIGVGNYPAGRPQDFTDNDLQVQPFFRLIEQNDDETPATAESTAKQLDE